MLLEGNGHSGAGTASFSSAAHPSSRARRSHGWIGSAATLGQRPRRMDRFDCRDAQCGGGENSEANVDARRQQSHERRISEAGFNRSDERENENGTITVEKKAPYPSAVTRTRVRFAAAVAAIATSNDGSLQRPRLRAFSTRDRRRLT